MQLKRHKAPYISHPDNSRIFMINVIISLLILYLISFYFYGSRAILLGMVSVLTTVVSEIIMLLLFRKKIQVNDLSSVVTGLIIPLMMPASIPFKVPVLAAVFAMVVAKHPFGGTGANVFNPAAAGYAFVISCFSSEVMFMYPRPLQVLPIYDLSGVILNHSTSFTLGVGGIPSHSPLTLILGNVPGPMGATNILALLGCLFFLLYRRTINIQMPIVFLATTSLFSAVFRRVNVSATQSMFYELTSGLIVFGAVFMLADPVTIPKRTVAKVFYAFICGIIVMIFRYLGRVEETFMFSILIMNGTVWGFDIIYEKYASILRRKRFENNTNPQLPEKTLP